MKSAAAPRGRAERASELSERRVAEVRRSFDAGRVAAPVLRAAEQELLQLREGLQRRERELAEARRMAGADAPAAPGGEEPPCDAARR
jgi:hypothetical protein